MGYLIKAFGSFEPQIDEDASIKFCLDLVLADERITELAEFVSDLGQIGGIEGDPGWLIERRDSSDTSWPDSAMFKATVDKLGYELLHPEFFMTKKEFMGYVKKAIEAFIAINSTWELEPAIISIRRDIEFE